MWLVKIILRSLGYNMPDNNRSTVGERLEKKEITVEVANRGETENNSGFSGIPTHFMIIIVNPLPLEQ